MTVAEWNELVSGDWITDGVRKWRVRLYPDAVVAGEPKAIMVNAAGQGRPVATRNHTKFEFVRHAYARA